MKIFRRKLYAATFYVTLICLPAARATFGEFDEVPVTRWVDASRLAVVNR